MTDESAREEGPAGSWRVVALLSVVVFISVAAGSMVNVALPAVGRHFSVSAGTYGWLVTGYMLTFAIFGAVHGRLSSRIGARRLYLAGLALFSVSAVLAASAHSIWLMIVARTLQGVGAASMPAIGSLIVSRLFPTGERGAALGTLLGVSGIAAGVGPFIGGALVQFFHWRVVFLCPALTVTAMILGWWWLPRSLDERTKERFDVVGAALLSFSAALLLLSIKFLESAGASLMTGGTVALSVLGAAMFIWWIRRVDAPFVPPSLFRERRYVLTVVVAFLNQASRVGTGIMIPIILIECNGIDPVWVGGVLLPGAMATALASRTIGRWADTVGARIPVTIGSFCIIAGNLISSMFVGTSELGLAVGTLLYGLGFAFIQSPCIGTIPRILPQSMSGVGIGLYMMIFFLGGAFGAAMSVAVLVLQPADAAAWIGMDVRGGGYSNAVLSLTWLPILGLLLTPGLPGKVRP